MPKNCETCYYTSVWECCPCENYKKWIPNNEIRNNLSNSISQLKKICGSIDLPIYQEIRIDKDLVKQFDNAINKYHNCLDAYNGK